MDIHDIPMSLVVTNNKDCFYAFYKLGNAPKSVSAEASLQRSLRPLAGGEGARRVPPPPRTSGTQAMLCHPPTPPENKS